MSTAVDARTDVNTEVANQVLAFFAQAANRNWKSAIRDTEDEELAEAAVIRVGELLEEAQRPSPVGTYIGSTSMAKATFGGDGEVFSEAVRHLKDAQRLYQVGRGRGKVIVVLDDTPLGETVSVEPRMASLPAAEVVRPEPEWDDASVIPAPQFVPDIADLFAALQENFSRQDQEISQLREQNKSLSEQLETIRTALQR